MARFVLRRLLWTIPILWVVITDRLLHDALDRRRSLPPREACRALERGLGQSTATTTARDSPEPAREVWARPPLVRAVRQLPEGRRDARPRAFPVVPVHARHRHHQGDGAALLRAGAARVRLAVAVGVPVGIVAALRPGSAFDHGVRLFTALGISLPSFFMATLLIYYVFGEARCLPHVGVERRLAEQGAPYLHSQPRAHGLLSPGPARHAARDL